MAEPVQNLMVEEDEIGEGHVIDELARGGDEPGGLLRFGGGFSEHDAREINRLTPRCQLRKEGKIAIMRRGPEMLNFRALPLLAILIACSLLLAPRAFADPTSDRIAALLERYRCPVFAYLLAIHKTPTVLRLDNRFLILEIAHRIDHGYYAQCAFDDLDRKMICEVSSPAFHPDLKPYFEGANLKRVKALGYQARRRTTIFSGATPARLMLSMRSPAFWSKPSVTYSTCSLKRA
jgi:hypothetical protein